MQAACAPETEVAIKCEMTHSYLYFICPHWRRDTISCRNWPRHIGEGGILISKCCDWVPVLAAVSMTPRPFSFVHFCAHPTQEEEGSMPIKRRKMEEITLNREVMKQPPGYSLIMPPPVDIRAVCVGQFPWSYNLSRKHNCSQPPSSLRLAQSRNRYSKRTNVLCKLAVIVDLIWMFVLLVKMTHETDSEKIWVQSKGHVCVFKL